MFDIESNDWTKFEMAGGFDGEDYRFFTSVRELIKWFLHRSNRGKTFYAHNGGKFDFNFLYDELRKLGRRVNICAQGSRVIALVIDLDGRQKVRIHDSIVLFPEGNRSLESLTKAFKTEHQKLKETIDFSKERISKENAEHRRYLEHDCRALYEVLDGYRELPLIKDVGFKLTLASTALAVWRTQTPESIRITPDFVNNFVRKAKAGGRCEIFRASMGEGYHFDANSLYPTVMQKPIPCEYLGPSRDPFEFGFHEVTVDVPDCYIPTLWIQTPKLIFPTGVIRGTFFSEEIKAAVQNGAKLVKHHFGQRFTESTELFGPYVERLYQMRMENRDNAIGYIAKALMNNTYGKFAEHEEKKSLTMVNPVDPSTWPKEKNWTKWRSEEFFRKNGLVTITKTMRQSHMLAHISAAVAAYGRIEMLKNAYIPHEKTIYYTDTDSCFTTKPMKTGPSLGEMKLEYEINRAYFLLPKGYYVETKDGREIKKLKGFSREYLDKLTISNYHNKDFKESFTKIASLRKALIEKNEYLALITSTKSLKSEYDKRLLYPDGNTRPWHLRDGKLI